jgi:glycosyltransferase involved in cell wall biosynthesis
MDTLLYVYGNKNDVKVEFDKNFIDVRLIQKPFLLRKTDNILTYMFPNLLARQLKESKLSSLQPKVVLVESAFIGYCTLKVLKFPNDASLKIYDSQNIEVNYHKHSLNYLPFKGKVLKRIETIQRVISEKADVIFSPSQEEIEIFKNKYHVNPSKLILVPNGIDTSRLKPLDYQSKHILKERMGWGYSFHVVFMGSRIKPNIDACKIIINNIANKLSDVAFIIIGSVSELLGNVPPNVKKVGTLSFSEKNKFLQLSDIGINPVLHGAGTNSKMVEYMSAGLAIVTTRVGARGLDLTHNTDAIIVDDMDIFPKFVSQVLDDEYLKEKLQKNARIKSELYDWKNIALTIKQNLPRNIA